VIEGPFLIELDVDDSSWTDLPPAVFTLLEGAEIAPSPTNESPVVLRDADQDP